MLEPRSDTAGDAIIQSMLAGATAFLSLESDATDDADDQAMAQIVTELQALAGAEQTEPADQDEPAGPVAA